MSDDRKSLIFMVGSLALAAAAFAMLLWIVWTGYLSPQARACHARGGVISELDPNYGCVKIIMVPAQ